MRLIAKERGLTYQQIFVILAAISLSFLVYKLNPLQLLAIVGIAIILVASFLRVKASLLVILAIKPFLDLAWDVRFFSMGQKEINVLHLTGFYVFLIGAYIYFGERESLRKFNEKLIWCFIAIHLFSSFIGLVFYGNSMIGTIDSLLRLFDAYFIYFTFHHFYQDNHEKLQFIIKIIWISSLLVSCVSVIFYLSGKYNIDVSQGVERFAGIYNDPGGPSYMAIMSLMFGTLFLNVLKNKNMMKPIYYILYTITIFVTLIILAIAVTKSAYLMFFVFLFMWIGIYKKKMHIILPLLIIGSIYVYSTSEKIHLRMENEVRFFSEGKFTIEAARPMGTGRVARWERFIKGYSEGLNLFKQMFGIYRNVGAHNQYFAYLTEVGFLGLSIFLIILTRFFWRLANLYKHDKKPEIFMAITMLLVFSIISLFGHAFEWTTTLWYVMVLLSLINVKHTKIISNSPHTK